MRHRRRRRGDGRAIDPCPSRPARGAATGSRHLADGAKQVAARLLAAATNLSADTAMVVVGRMPLALLGTSTTRDYARLHRGAHHAEIGLGLTGHDPACRVAYVSTVKI